MNRLIDEWIDECTFLLHVETNVRSLLELKLVSSYPVEGMYSEFNISGSMTHSEMPPPSPDFEHEMQIL